MKITKRQLRRIIKEERSRILKEYSGDGPDRFEEIMAEMNELNNEALDIARNSGDSMIGERAYRYWYAHIQGAIGSENEFLGGSMTPMSDTLEELNGGGEEEMMEMGYEDGVNGRPPAHPNNEVYMDNYEDGKSG